MSLRSKVTMEVLVGFDNALNDLAFGRSLEELLDTCVHVKTANYTLAALEADTAVDLDDLAEGRLLYIEADGEITVKINGAAAGLPVSRMGNPSASGTATQKAYMLTTLQLTSLSLTNPHATESRIVRVCIVGDLSA